MADKKIAANSVKDMVEKLKADPTTRFSKNDFQTLVYAVLSDKEFKAKKYLMRAQDMIEEEYSPNQAMGKFMDKLLRHAGMANPQERANVIDTFECSPKDMEWISDAVDEALWIYTDCGKNTRLFRDKMLQLTIKKIERNGKYAGQIGFKKQVVDRAAKLAKKK